MLEVAQRPPCPIYSQVGWARLQELLNQIGQVTDEGGLRSHWPEPVRYRIVGVGL